MPKHKWYYKGKITAFEKAKFRCQMCGPNVWQTIYHLEAFGHLTFDLDFSKSRSRVYKTVANCFLGHVWMFN